MSVDTLYTTLVDIPLQAVYAFVNEIDRKVYVCASQDTIMSISQNVSALKQFVHRIGSMQDDAGKMWIRILETVEDSTELMLRENYWKDQFLSEGYTLYNNRNRVQYRIREELDIETGRIIVKLVSRRNKQIVVGVFNTKREVDCFVSKNYSKGIYNITYAKNLATNWFLKRIRNDSE